MSRRHKRYPQEYKRRMVELYRSGRSAESLGREFEASANAILKWIKQAEIDEGRGGDGELTTTEREELRRLRRRVAELQEEREILKKAAAWFARESGSIPKKDSSS